MLLKSLIIERISIKLPVKMCHNKNNQQYYNVSIFIVILINSQSHDSNYLITMHKWSEDIC